MRRGTGSRFRHGLPWRLLALLPACLAGTGAGAADDLERGFADPPHAARPWVWWHWMNGNVSADGVRKDLRWMARAGIGGAQQFEGGLGAPQVVPERLTYLGPPWREALRAGAEEADRLGIELGVATSPGWSETGGSWVRPEDAMKKLVWTSTVVRPGAGPVRLARPPDVAGPYGDVPAAAVEAGAPAGPRLFRDARVIAFPTPAAAALPPATVFTSTPGLDPAALGDGAWGAPLRILPAPGSGDGWILFDFGRPVTLRSAMVGIPEPGGFGAPPPTDAVFQWSADGRGFRDVAALPPTASPVRTASFAPVAARWFRLVLRPDPRPGPADAIALAPGAVRPRFGPPPPEGFPVSEVQLATTGRVARAEEQAGFATLPDDFADPTPPLAGVDPARVLDLSARLRPDGTLGWRPRAGNWTVLRLGWSPTGHRNGPAPAEATGLEVDKLDPARVAAYARRYLAQVTAAAGGAGRLKGLLSDSIEAGPQNWTEGLPDAFRRLRGYDPTPWLPALTGVVVGDAARTDRFLWDWRATIADLYASAHYAELAAAAHAAGLTYYAEALEDHRPQLGDDLAMRAPADVPMGAMWAIGPGEAPRATFVADLKGAASVADLHGRPLVAAESLTAAGHPYAFAPADLKRTVDLEFALGVNRIMIHSSPHQPLPDAPPGVALAPFLGQYFSRNETWAELARGWTDYLARTSFLLQQGHKAADVLVLAGETVALTALYGDRPFDGVPPGHDFDFTDGAALRSQLRVAGGRLLSPGGQLYGALLLAGDSGRLTVPTLRRLRAFVAAGVPVVGPRPLASPSLADDPREFDRLVRDIWDDGAGGAARAHPAAALDRALLDAGTPPDWAWHGAGAVPAVLHRVSDARDIYFVVNRSAGAVAGAMRFRVAGRAPELWHADTGRIEPTSFRRLGDGTEVPLSLRGEEAVFVVFRTPDAVAERRVAPPVDAPVARLARWTVAFQPGRGAPAGTAATTLTPWNEDRDPGVRYFSGIGTYRTRLGLGRTGGRLLLDLGRVGDVARVTVNGREAGIAWKAPYRVDVSGLLRRGRNDIMVEVANLWVNRLVGDAQPGARPVAHSYGPTYAADAPLRFSGLAGPVTLVSQRAGRTGRGGTGR